MFFSSDKFFLLFNEIIEIFLSSLEELEDIFIYNKVNFKFIIIIKLLCDSSAS